MHYIEKKDGKVYLVEGDRKGFETYHFLGLDQEYWEAKEKAEKAKPKKKKKSED